jgi:hypothetical protein
MNQAGPSQSTVPYSSRLLRGEHPIGRHRCLGMTRSERRARRAVLRELDRLAAQREGEAQAPDTAQKDTEEEFRRGVRFPRRG